MESPPVQWCLECGNQLTALFFVGERHDGYVCEQCGLYYSISLRKLSHVYWGKPNTHVTGGNKA